MRLPVRRCARLCSRSRALPDLYYLAAWMDLYIGDAATTIIFHFLLCPRVDELVAVPVHVDDGSLPHNAMRKQGRRREAEENGCVGFHDDDDDDDDCS